MRVQESRENYLEAILMLQKKLGYVRSVDVANHLNFSRPSVSVAMANLRNLGLVTTDEHGFLHLTDEGRAEAEKVLERHLLITDWLVGLGVGEETAAEDAWRIEHVILSLIHISLKRCPRSRFYMSPACRCCDFSALKPSG